MARAYRLIKECPEDLRDRRGRVGNFIVPMPDTNGIRVTAFTPDRKYVGERIFTPDELNLIEIEGAVPWVIPTKLAPLVLKLPKKVK